NGTRNFHKLLFGHREAIDLGIGRDFGADPLEELRGARVTLLPPYTAQTGGRLEAQRDILRDSELWEQRRLLVNTSDPQLMRSRRREVANACVGDLNPAAVRLMRAGDKFDERRFSGAILAKDSMHFAGPQIER